MTTTTALGAVVLAVLVTGCSGFSNPRFGGTGNSGTEPGYEEFQEQNYVEPDHDEPPADWVHRPVHTEWVCTYSPTYNQDWHDDVLCENGTAVDRPYLLPNDPFVTEAEIMEAAAAYEAQLNTAG